MGSKLWHLGRKSVSLPAYWVGDQRNEGSSCAQQTLFGLAGRTDGPAVSLKL